MILLATASLGLTNPAAAIAVQNQTAANASLSEAAASIPLVMLTYPSQITPAAERRIGNIYAKSKWPSGCGNFMTPCATNDDALDQALVRTAYFLPDVHEALERSFPGSVVLQPATIDVDASGQLVYKLANPELPAAARIDFMTYVAPRVMGQSPSATAFTHGLHVLPMFAATTVHGAQGQKLIAISEGLSPDLGNGPTSVLVQLIKGVDSKPKRGPKELSFSKKPWKITDSQWQHVAGGQNPFFMVETAAASLAPITGALKRIDREAAARDNLPTYRAIYANELQTAGSLGEAALPTFISAEVEFTRQVARDFLKEIRSSEVGASVRKAMIAEREFNKKASTSKWLSALTAGLGGLAGGLAGGASALMGPQMLLSAMQEGISFRTAQQQFSSGMTDLTAAQRTLTVQLGSNAKQLSGNSIAQFRSQFRELLLKLGQPEKPAKPARKKRK